MKCPSCQSDWPEGRRFCAHCGTGLWSRCRTCGQAIRAGSGTCTACGDSLSPPLAAVVAPDVPQFPATTRRTAKFAVDSERKLVTILFADIRGSMELVADLDPEDAQSFLDPVIKLMMEAVHHYEGTVNQVMGDGIMALFGAPVAHEDHAVRAGYAALKMQESIAAYAAQQDRKSTRLNSSHRSLSRMPSSA